MIARLIRASIANRLFVLVAAIALAAAGVWSVARTPLDALPDLSDTQVIIRTEWPGQTPRIVEDQVTYPLTTTMLSVPGVKAVRGFSFFGDSFVYVLFDDNTTCSPPFKPASTSVTPLPLRPVCTRTGWNAPSAPRTMTRACSPAPINASVGTSGRSAPAVGCKTTCANMPGASRPSGLSKTMRTRWVRLPASTCGNNVSTRPWKGSVGNASRVASTGVPAAIPALPACGIDASSQTVRVPLTRNNNVPIGAD